MLKSYSKAVSSKVSLKSQTVLPREVRERLGIRPGDRLRYVSTREACASKEAPREKADPLAAFREWSSEADGAAYGDL